MIGSVSATLLIIQCHQKNTLVCEFCHLLSFLCDFVFL